MREKILTDIEMFTEEIVESLAKLRKRYTKAESKRLRKALTRLRQETPSLKTRLVEADKETK